MESRGGNMAANATAFDADTTGSAAGDGLTAADRQRLLLTAYEAELDAEITRLDREHSDAVAADVKTYRLTWDLMVKEMDRIGHDAKKKYEDATMAAQAKRGQVLKDQEEKKAAIRQVHKRKKDELELAAAQQKSEKPDYAALVTELLQQNENKVADYRAELNVKFHEKIDRIQRDEQAAEDDLLDRRSTFVKCTEEDLDALESETASSIATIDELQRHNQESYKRDYEAERHGSILLSPRCVLPGKRNPSDP